MRFWPGVPHRAKPSLRLTLTRDNVAVALATSAVTVIGLGIGPGSFGPQRNATGNRSTAGSGSTPGTEPPERTLSALTQPTDPGALGQPSHPTHPPGGSDGPIILSADALGEVDARGGPGRIVVSWQLSKTSASRLRATISGNDGSRPTSTCRPTATGCTFTNLTNGVEYTVGLSLREGKKVVARTTVRAIPYPAVLVGRTTRLWFDPADPGSYGLPGREPAPGTPVISLLDRSASASDATTSPRYDSPTVATLNGHPVLRFGANGGLSFPASSLPNGSAPSTVYVVAAQDSPTQGTDCFAHLLVWGSLEANRMRGLHKGCRTSLAYADTYQTWNRATPALGWHVGRTQIMRADFTATTLSVRMNGAPSYTWKQPDGATMNTASGTDGMLGATPYGPGTGWRGRIAEVIVLSAAPSAAENTAIMQYLKRKWGP